jgi:hypothetical protein
MPDVHLVVGVAVIASNLLAGIWGGVAWLRRRPSVGFWYLLRIAQALVVIQVLLGAVLLLLGYEPADGLHYVYGLLPLLVALLAEGARSGMAERELGGMDFHSLPRERQRAVALAIVRNEMGVMTLSVLVIFGLALRAGLTTPAL